ncbi:DUF2799 domain-containing protein [Vibrio sp. WXL210]|uniref:DUF2799 domain-containing protein n=1 Tax=Vibrio sp. WXL210 TaxID=3450709 RepID=UPI003EC8509A
MNQKMKLVLASIGLALVGCSSSVALNYGQTWEQFGYQEAMHGELLLEQARFEGNTYGEYRKGYAAGLKELCSQDGYEFGLSGFYYQGSCDAINPEFAVQHNKGWVDAEIDQMNYDNERDTYLDRESDFYSY